MLTLRRPYRALYGPHGKPQNVVGMATLQLTYKGIQSAQNVFIIRGLIQVLIGKPAIEDLRLVLQLCNLKTRSLDSQKDYPHLFRGLGILQEEYCLRINPTATPFTVTSRRRVSLLLYASTREELKNMEHLAVIAPVHEPTE